MKNIELDCQGLPCPQPVLECKAAIEKKHAQSILVKVDNAPARENVTRFLNSKGYTITNEVEEKGLYTITASITGENCTTCEIMEDHEIAQLDEKITVFITSNSMGKGDETLGEKLMINFIKTLPEMGTSLWRIVFVNSGVTLTTSDSPALESLKALVDSGVSILVCGTCLEHFNLLESKQVGETTNMLDVVTSLQLASKVIQV